MNLALCGIEPRIPRLQFMLSYQWATSADGHYYFRHNIFCNFPTFKMKRKITLKKWKFVKIRFFPELKDLEIFDFCYVLPQSSGDADFSVRIMIRTINMAPDQIRTRNMAPDHDPDHKYGSGSSSGWISPDDWGRTSWWNAKLPSKNEICKNMIFARIKRFRNFDFCYVLPQSYEKAVFLVRISHFLDFFLRIKTFGLRIMIRTLNMASDQGS